MKTVVVKGWKWLLGALLGILGFDSCDGLGLFRCEYGSPHADYKLLGDVKNTKGKPIQGIRVVFERMPEVEYELNDTLYTDARGHFEKDLRDDYWYSGAIVRFEDVDGAENGSYKTKVLTKEDLTFEQTGKGDRSWYEGAFSVHADAILEEDN